MVFSLKDISESYISKVAHAYHIKKFIRYCNGNYHGIVIEIFLAMRWFSINQHSHSASCNKGPYVLTTSACEVPLLPCINCMEGMDMCLSYFKGLILLAAVILVQIVAKWLFRDRQVGLRKMYHTKRDLLRQLTTLTVMVLCNLMPCLEVDALD